MSEIVKFHLTSNSACTLVMRNTDHPADSNVFELGQDGKIVNFIGKGQDEIKTAHTGFFVFNSRILKLIPDGKCDIEKDVIANIYSTHNITGYITDSYTRDMGTPGRLERIEEDIRKGVIQ